MLYNEHIYVAEKNHFIEHLDNNLFLRLESPPSDLTGKVYGGIHTLPPSGFELVTS